MPFVAFKLAENNVKTIISIERIEPLKYILKTDNGSYLVETTILPLPITKVEKIAPSVKTFNP